MKESTVPVTREQVAERVEAQRELCARSRLPHFAPWDGICWSCRRQIYEIEDGRSFVTGCPHCNKSYCD